MKDPVMLYCLTIFDATVVQCVYSYYLARDLFMNILIVMDHTYHP